MWPKQWSLKLDLNLPHAESLEQFTWHKSWLNSYITQFQRYLILFWQKFNLFITLWSKCGLDFVRWFSSSSTSSFKNFLNGFWLSQNSLTWRWSLPMGIKRLTNCSMLRLRIYFSRVNSNSSFIHPSIMWLNNRPMKPFLSLYIAVAQLHHHHPILIFIFFFFSFTVTMLDIPRDHLVPLYEPDLRQHCSISPRTRASWRCFSRAIFNVDV